MIPPDFPRVLVVTSNNFNQISGGGITLTNLFRGWPADRIANLHEDSAPEDDAVCHNFYRLSKEEVRLTWPFSLAQSCLTILTRTFGETRPLKNSTNGLSIDRRKETAITRRVLRGLVGEIPATVRISDPLGRWLDTFRPELLYSFLGSMAQIRLTREIARRVSLPLAVHIMDDWPAIIYRSGLLAPLLRRTALKEFEAVLRDSTLRLGICEEMCEEYRVRYGYQFLAFHNALDLEQWLLYAKRDWRVGSPLVVRYVGSILPGAQRDSLRDICDAVSTLRASGMMIEMWVHSPREQAAHLHDGHFPREGLHVAEPPHPHRIVEVLVGADLLVLPFNFDSRSTQHIRLSFPTKVPAYMASGTPILVYGPPGIAIVRSAQRDGWGHVVSTRGVSALRDAIVWLMADQAMRERMGRRAQALAMEHHDASRIRPTFQNTLATAVAGKGRKNDKGTEEEVLADLDAGTGR